MASIINGRGFVGVRTGTVSSGPSIVTDGLKLYLDAGNASSYPGTGLNWNDISGNGNNATLNGPGGSGLPSYNSANGGSISFDGTDDYGNLDNMVSQTNFTATNSFSISVWFKSNTLPAGGANLLSRNSNSLGNWFSRTEGSAFRGGVQDPLGNSATKTSSTIVINQWYNGVVVYNGTNKTTTVYLNNISQGSQTNNSLTGNLYNVNAISIGRRNNGSGDLWFNGSIANTLLYNKALSASEIQQNYNVLKGRFGL